MKLAPAVWPNAGVEAWYRGRLQTFVREMAKDTAKALHAPEPLALDASPFEEAAGIMFRCDDHILFLHRTDGEGWAFPGGSCEYGELPYDCALREAGEETGWANNITVPFLAPAAGTNIVRGVRFTTFVVDLERTFTPTLNAEHDRYSWHTAWDVLYGNVAMQLHPGVRLTLEGKTGVALDSFHPDQDRDNHGRWTAQGMSDALENIVDLAANNPNEGPKGERERLAWALQLIVEWRPDDKRVKKAHKTEAARVLRQMHEHPDWTPGPKGATDAAPTPGEGFAFFRRNAQLQHAIGQVSHKWTLRLEKLSLDLSKRFADKSRITTDAMVQRSFAKAGLTLKFKPTKAMREMTDAVVAENVSLIKSIPVEFHQQVRKAVRDAVLKGGDLATLTKVLEERYGVTHRRAAFIARDQNAKAKAIFEHQRRREIGIKRAQWLHSAAGKEPRPTHVAANGESYSIEQGRFDSAVNRFILPGEEPNCRCASRAEIEGFE